jgi:hypothetical protein
VNWTPYFLEDLLALRDTWILLTLGLAATLGIVIVLLVFLRRCFLLQHCVFLLHVFLRRICLAIALIEQGSRAVSQVHSSGVISV